MADDSKLKIDGDFDPSKKIQKGIEEATESVKKLGKNTAAASKVASKGMAKFAESIGGAGEAMLESFLVYKTTGSKIAAVFSAIAFGVQEKLIGRLTLVAGLAFGALKGIDKLAVAFRDMTIGAAAGMETLVTQFTPLLKSASAAKERMRELEDFAIGTPFDLEDLVAANKTLETLTRGALSGEKGMTMVGDAAAVSGVSFESAARNIARLYDNLMNGRAPGFAAMRLAELGLITGNTRNKLEDFNASGVSGEKVWKVVADELARTSGAMAAMENNLDTLNSNWADALAKLKAGFGKNFLEGEKASMRALNRLVEELTPEVEKMGEEFAFFPNQVKKAQASIINFFTSVVGKSGLLSNAFSLLTTGLVGITGGAAFVGMKGLVDLMGFYKKNTEGAKTATMQLAGSTKLAVKSVKEIGKGNLTKGLDFAAAATNMAVFGANAKKAETGAGRVAQRMKGMGAASKNLPNSVRAMGLVSVALTGVKKAAKTTAGVLGAMLLPSFTALTSKMFLIPAAITMFVGGLFQIWARSKQTTEALEELKAATGTTTKELKRLQDSVSSQADVVKLHAEQVRKLEEAQKRLREEEKKGSEQWLTGNKKRIAGAKEALNAIKTTIGETRDFNPENFTPSTEKKDRLASEAVQARQIDAQTRAANRQFMSPEKRREDLKKEISANRRILAKANVDLEGKGKAVDEIARRDGQKKKLEERKKQAEDDIKTRENFIKKRNNAARHGKSHTIPKPTVTEEEFKSAKEELKEILTEIANLPTDLDINKKYDSELTKLGVKLLKFEEKLKNPDLDQNSKEAERFRKRKRQLTEEIAEKKALAEDTRANAKQNIAAGIEERNSIKAQIVERKRLGKIDLELSKKQKENSGVQGQFDNIDAEIEKVNTNPLLDQEDKDTRIGILNNQKDALKKITEIQNNAALAQTRADKHRAEALVHSLKGETKLAAMAMERAQNTQREFELQSKIREIKETFPEGDRRKTAIATVEEESKTSIIAETLGKQQDVLATLKEQQAVQATLAGESEKAISLSEEAAKLRDQRESAGRVDDLVKAGLTPDDAKDTVDAELALKSRERERSRNQGSRVVASDLTRIGGGSKVVGIDPIFDKMTAEAKKQTKFLEAIDQKLENNMEKTNADLVKP